MGNRVSAPAQLVLLSDPDPAFRYGLHVGSSPAAGTLLRDINNLNIGVNVYIGGS